MDMLDYDELSRVFADEFSAHYEDSEYGESDFDAWRGQAMDSNDHGDY